ncbi:hypothetical protein FAES_2066 [Fibrella aestuarina BUZ 2]|uniref:Uncharacterized protein n=1 Tax=Fibrella aestuarina BUZ 2 TaxID=1166018 RepID=I0K7H2_9BACT|nr:hypothetical protein FAES_2066 [Fibrella aestuarina BUZ 2]
MLINPIADRMTNAKRYPTNGKLFFLLSSLEIDAV